MKEKVLIELLIVNVILLGGFFRSVFCFLYLKIIFLHKNDSVMTNIEYRKISEIKKLDGNPRKISKEQMNILKESISKNADYFEARPIILSDRTGELVIIAGNQRYEACLQLGIETVPTVLLSGLTEEREREIIIRDNVNNGEWDQDLLKDWDTELLSDWGVDVPEWEEATHTKEKKDLSDNLDQMFKLEIECETEYNLQEMYEELTGRGYVCRILTL